MSVNVNVHFWAEFVSYPRHIVVSMGYTWTRDGNVQGWCSALVTRLGRNVAVVRTWPEGAISQLVRVMRERGWDIANPLPECAWSVLWEPGDIDSARLGEFADACVGVGVNAYGYDLRDEGEPAELCCCERSDAKGEAGARGSGRLATLSSVCTDLRGAEESGNACVCVLSGGGRGVLPVRVGVRTPRGGKRIIFAELTVAVTREEDGHPGVVQAYTHLYGAGGDLVRARAACRRRFVIDTLHAEQGIVALRIDHLDVLAGMSDVAAVARDLSDCLLAAGCVGPVIIRRVTGMNPLDGAMGA